MNAQRKNTDELNRSVFISDNLPFLRSLDSESIDLVIIDPPFGKNQTFQGKLTPPIKPAELKEEQELMNSWDVFDVASAYAAGLEYPDQTGTTAKFEDIWDFKKIARREELDELDSTPVGYLIDSTYYTHSPSHAAYIYFMAVRMIEIKRILKQTGSVYLHCDHSANGYLRQMMDAIFQPENFRNEIIWHYGKWSNAVNYFQRNHDAIYYYTKSNDYTFNPIYMPRRKETAYHTNIIDNQGQLLVYDREATPDAVIASYEKKGYKIVFVDKKGVLEHDVWSYHNNKELNFINSQSKERTGYPTQKPQALAKRIIEVSSKAGDIVLDCFAGCAYVPVAAELTGRRWLACDMSPRAWTVVKRQFGKQPELNGSLPQVRGPKNLPKHTTPPAPVQHQKRFKPEYKYKQTPLETDAQIWQAFINEWGTGCWYCGQEKLADRRELHLDHIQPNEKDGTNDDCWNRALACAPCNSDKRDDKSAKGTTRIAFDAGRIATPARMEEILKGFNARTKWSKQRFERIKKEKHPLS